jgi:hypothetical protein
VGNIEIHIVHHRIVAVSIVTLQQLLAEDALGRGVTIVQAIQVRETESPIEVIRLYRIRQAFDVEGNLVKLEGVRDHVIGGFVVGVPALVRGAGVTTDIEPAVNLDAAFVLVDRLHQAVSAVIRSTDHNRAAHRPVCRGKRGRVQGTWGSPAGRLGGSHRAIGVDCPIVQIGVSQARKEASVGQGSCRRRRRICLRLRVRSILSSDVQPAIKDP